MFYCGAGSQPARLRFQQGLQDPLRSDIKRDANLCVICHAAASDAHHIMERRLFDDGGY